MTNSNRETESKWASKLQKVLGNGYEIRYDACESGMTFCYYNGKLYKQVENSAMCGSINVIDYKVKLY